MTVTAIEQSFPQATHGQVFGNEEFMHHAVDHLTHVNGPLAPVALAGGIVADAAKELIDSPTPTGFSRCRPYTPLSVRRRWLHWTHFQV